MTFQRGKLLSAGYDGFVRSWERTPGAWSTVGESLVSVGGRALCLASNAGGDRVLCGTSDGDVVLLTDSDLETVGRLHLGGSGSARRATAIASIPMQAADEEKSPPVKTAPTPGAGDTAFVVGDSAGELHVVRVDV